MTTDPTPPSEENAHDAQEKRYELVNQLLGKETFIDPLNPEEVTKAYGVLERSPDKITLVLVESFKQYCRKCIRETAFLEVKNEISQATMQEADNLKQKVVDEWYQKVKDDNILQQLLMMLLFKNHYWEWVRFGLKDIFSQQRMQPGHEINSYLNARFHKLKAKKAMKTVGDLVIADVTEIVNIFKGEIMQKKIKLFD
ncbi:MAG: hypothetical protein HOK67_00620 [Deltaproteobacteria bacterium]|nr:hypothetical protein [Deltaproteobacteria bacterium]